MVNKKILLMSYLMFGMNMVAEEGFVEVIGGKIWYKIYGQEFLNIKPPLVLLHGGPGCTHDYLLPLTQLSDERAVVVYDQLGAGNSVVSGNQKELEYLWDKDRFVQELECLVKMLDVEKIDLFGHSWGGILALEYTLKNPEKINKLCLASPLISTAWWAADTRRLLGLLPENIQNTIYKCEQNNLIDSDEYFEATKLFYKAFLCRLPVDQRPAEYLRTGQLMNLAIYNHMWGPSEFTVTGNLKTYDRSGDLFKLSMPVLLTCGRYDEATPETMAIVQSRINDVLANNAQLIIYEQSAHQSHLEESALYLDDLRNFLNS